MSDDISSPGDDLSLRFKTFYHTNAESTEVTIVEDDIKLSEAECRRSPIGKVVSSKMANLHGIKNTMLKINVDEAVCRSSNTIGTGAVARRDNGQVVGIFLAIHDGINLSRIAEALAIRNGLKLGTALMCPKVHIESDAEAIMRRCNDDQDPPSDIAVVLHDCSVLKKSFTSCGFGFVKRECNRAAHCCAQKALSNAMSGLWTSILPSWGSYLSDI